MLLERRRSIIYIGQNCEIIRSARQDLLRQIGTFNIQNKNLE